MGATEKLIKNIVNTTYDTLPVDVLEPTKRQILDTLGVASAGAVFGNVKPLVDLVKEWGGKEESTILSYGGRVPSPNAAFINGTLAVVLDWDDTDDYGFLHVSRGPVPAAFAIAERKGGISGKELMVAVALGFDLSARLSRATTGFLHGGLGFEIGISNWFGAAAAASKLLNLDEEKTGHALAIAFQLLCPASGAWTEVYPSPTYKGIEGGLAAKAGVMAAMMAERGMTGAGDRIESKGGFYDVYHRGKYHPEILTLDLGKVFAGTTNSQKPWPGCRFNHAPDTATLALVHEYDIKPEDVTEVIVHCGPHIYGLHQPLEKKQSPACPISAEFSVPWSVANAIVRRKIDIAGNTEQGIKDKKVLDIAHKVFPKLTPEFTMATAREPVIVEIKTKKGEVFSKRVDVAYGSHDNPMSFSDVAEKFRYCCNYSVKPIPKGNPDKVVQMVERLEDVTDVSEVIRLLA